MKWRIYRLPGSRETWLIDHGPGSLVLTCRLWEHGLGVTTKSVNGDPAATPRAWIEVSESDLAIFYPEGLAQFSVRQGKAA